MRLTAKHILIAMAVSAVVALSVASATAGIMRHDVPWLEYENYGQTDPRFDAAGWIGVDYADGSTWKGSLTLVDPYWALTASHMFDGPDGQGNVTDMTIRFGNNGLSDYHLEVAAAEWIPHPDWDTDAAFGSTPDIGLVRFANPIYDITPAERFRGTDQEDTLMHMAGYGAPGTHPTGPEPYDGVKRGGDNVISGFGTPGELPYFDYIPAYMLMMFHLYDVQPLEYHSAPGDSGAGWYADIDGVWQLAAVNVGVRGGYHYGASTVASRVSFFNDWIDSYVPEPSAGLMLIIGAVFLRRERAAA